MVGKLVILGALALAACGGPAPHLLPGQRLFVLYQTPEEIAERMKDIEPRAAAYTAVNDARLCVMAMPYPSAENQAYWSRLYAHEMRHCREGAFHD